MILVSEFEFNTMDALNIWMAADFLHDNDDDCFQRWRAAGWVDFTCMNTLNKARQLSEEKKLKSGYWTNQPRNRSLHIMDKVINLIQIMLRSRFNHQESCFLWKV